MRTLSYILTLALLLTVVVLPTSAADAETAETVELFVTLAGEPLAAVSGGDPVAFAATEAGSTAIADAEAELDAAAAAVRALGGTVLGSSWYLSRSLGVAVDADLADEVAAIPGVVSVERVLSRLTPQADAHLTATAADEPVWAADLLELDAIHAAGTTGEGILAAVIDTGFDLAHPTFAAADGAVGPLTPENMDERLELTSLARYSRNHRAAELYHSAKVGFAYDYMGDDRDVASIEVHGTHVASTLGGAEGVAPGVQLALMKVFTDGAGATTSDYAVYRAVEDAVLMGCDLISISLGNAPGYAYATNTFSLLSHLNEARALGCIVVCAMGNDGMVGAGSVYDAATGQDGPLTTHPDYGLAAEPATYPSALAVGAFVPDRVLESGLGAGDGFLFAYSDTAASQGFEAMKFMEVLGGQTLEYVVVPGLGEADDYAGLDVAGKLALVERGTITFVDKLAAAHGAGAVGMICYNNEEDEDIFNMAFDAMPAPAVSITRADGLRLVESRVKTVTVSDDLIRLTYPENAGQPAHYTAVSTGLTIKPAVSAPGYVYAAVPGGGYRTVSGTSMATPMVSGLCALALDAGNNERLQATADALIADLITTAKPNADASGHEYSVRRQGGGAIDAAALLAPAGSLRATDGRGLIELGDGLSAKKAFVVEATLTNTTAETMTYAISASVGSDAYMVEGEVAFVDEGAHAFVDALCALDGQNINRHREIPYAHTVTLEPGASAVLSVKIALSAAEADEYAAVFPCGFYLEGYLYANCAAGSLSIPYLGFAGDFAALDYFDGFGYDGEVTFYPDSYLYGDILGERHYLGENPNDGEAAYLRDLIAFSPDGDGSLDDLGYALNLMRNLYSFEMEVKDEAGRRVSLSRRGFYLTKAYEGGDGTLFSTLLSIWDGSSDDYSAYTMPDGVYTVTLRIFGMGDVVLEEATLPVMLDTAPPELVSSRVYEEDGVRKLAVTVRDNHYPKQAILYRTQIDDYGREVDLYRDDHRISYRAGRRAVTLVYDITGYEGSYLDLDLYDYAMNTVTLRLKLGA